MSPNDNTKIQCISLPNTAHFALNAVVLFGLPDENNIKFAINTGQELSFIVIVTIK